MKNARIVLFSISDVADDFLIEAEDINFALKAARKKLLGYGALVFGGLAALGGLVLAIKSKKSKSIRRV